MKQHSIRVPIKSLCTFIYLAPFKQYWWMDEQSLFAPGNSVANNGGSGGWDQGQGSGGGGGNNYGGNNNGGANQGGGYGQGSNNNKVNSGNKVNSAIDYFTNKM